MLAIYDQINRKHVSNIRERKGKERPRDRSDKIGESRLWWPASMAEKNVKIWSKRSRDANGRWWGGACSLNYSLNVLNTLINSFYNHSQIVLWWVFFLEKLAAATSHLANLVPLYLSDRWSSSSGPITSRRFAPRVLAYVRHPPLFSRIDHRPWALNYATI